MIPSAHKGLAGTFSFKMFRMHLCIHCDGGVRSGINTNHRGKVIDRVTDFVRVNHLTRAPTAGCMRCNIIPKGLLSELLRWRRKHAKRRSYPPVLHVQGRIVCAVLPLSDRGRCFVSSFMPSKFSSSDGRLQRAKSRGSFIVHLLLHLDFCIID